MKQFKGTQKDWSEVGHNDNGIFIGGKDSLGAICHVYYKNNEVSAEEGRANARLIANASDLLGLAITYLNDLKSIVPQSHARDSRIIQVERVLDRTFGNNES